MSHAVMYDTFPVEYDKSKIVADIREYVTHHGDRYGTQNVRFPSEKVFDNEEEAEKFIRENDRGDYDGVAAKFYDFANVPDSAKAKELRQKISDTIKKKDEYIKLHSVKTHKSAYIGCPKCGSKLNRELLSGERCPLCYTDLRSESTLKRIASFDAKVKEYEKKITEENLKRKSKAKVKWLVKFEYHC